MSSKKIGVVGLGFVGGAVLRAFHQKGFPVIGYDKYKQSAFEQQTKNSTELLTTDLIFLCLPTPFDSETGYDLSPLDEWCQYLEDHHYSGIVIIKSTVLPGNADRLSEKHCLPIIHNPEFLSARTALRDFLNQKHIVLGTTSLITPDQIEQLTHFYEQAFPEAELSWCLAGEAEAMKVFVNSFYAMKIQICNEFYVYAQKLNLDYQPIRELMLKNGWINPMHTQVPGSDGKLSYGGGCFPKDTNALLSQMVQVDSPCQMLAACIQEQKEMRK